MTKDPKAEPAGFAPAGGPKLETTGSARTGRSTETAGEEEDDAQLKSLRAVWLAMPEEEPPERGLAELMAAARVKADEMSAPSLWQRIVALLRRPPVLALATVLVLIGGAVFIGQRRDKLEPSTPTVTDERMHNAAPGPAAEMVAQPVTPEPAKQDESGAADGDSATAAPAEIAAPATEPAPPRAPSRVNRRPVLPRPESKTTTSRGTTNAQAGKSEGAVRDKPAADTKLFSEDREESEATISSDSFAPPPPAEAPRADSVTTTGTAPQGGEKAPAQPTRSRAPQYVAQAKSAAARGDCTAARTLMKRVASEDAAAYRTALAADTALKKCVIVAQ